MTNWRNWDFFGNNYKTEFNGELDAEYMEHELWKYQEKFGKEFGFRDLLTLKDIKAKSLIAEAIIDFPEYLRYQIEKNKRSNPYGDLVSTLDHIGATIAHLR